MTAALPWHHLFSYWAWLSFCAGLSVGRPLTPAASVVAMAFTVTTSASGVRGGGGTAHYSLRIAVSVWEIGIVAAHALCFPALRHMSWWRRPSHYVADTVLGVSYVLWLLANGTDPWTVYTQTLPESVTDKGVGDLADARWPVFVVPLALAMSVRLLAQDNRA